MMMPLGRRNQLGTNNPLNGTNPAQPTWDLYQSLVSMLSIEVSICTRLRDLLDQKQRVIISGNVDKLMAFTKEEAALTKQISDKVRDRVSVMNRIARSYDLDLEQPRLRVLKPLAPRDLAPALEKLVESSEKLAHQINDINHQNEYLLQASIDYARGMIDLLYNFKAENTTMYDLRGITGKQSDDTRWLDRKV